MVSYSSTITMMHGPIHERKLILTYIVDQRLNKMDIGIHDLYSESPEFNSRPDTGFPD